MASCAAAVTSKLLDFPRDIAFVVALPALLLSGWAALGHLITLDDDFPGGWSNPEKSKRIWWASIAELLVKLGLFAVLMAITAH